MVYRSLYFFTQAYHRSEATDPIAYLAHNADWLGILKRPQPPSPLSSLDLTNASDP
jgi:hypothetical protein